MSTRKNRLVEAVLTSTHNLCFEQKYEKNTRCFLSENFHLFGDKIFSIITKTRLYNFDLLKPHFYIVKLGFTGVYIIFLISAQKHRLWYSLEPPYRGGSNEYPQSIF